MELLVRIVDKGTADDCSKAGDVIAACPDGWAWSAAELTNPDWRIVRVSGLPQVSIDALTSKPLLQTDKRRRAYFTDFSKLPDPTLFTGARTQQIINLSLPQFLKAATKKP